MKHVSLRCCCGSSIELRDDAESLIDPNNGTNDKSGRRFLIELCSDEWQERHAICLQARIQAQTQPKPTRTLGRGKGKEDNE